PRACFAYILHCLSFFTDTATSPFYTLSLHDALPISMSAARPTRVLSRLFVCAADLPIAIRNLPSLVNFSTMPSFSPLPPIQTLPDRKSTRLNSSHVSISYAVFCLKKKIIHTQKMLEK